MAVRSNKFFNDPAMAQAAANLADLFAPPSGSDAAGYSLAQARDQETNYRKAMWDYSQRPDFDQTLLDRAGVIADLYDPSNSYYSVDKAADTQRYGYDTQAATSRSNNEADNIRALAENKANNAGAFAREYYGNLGRGETQPALSKGVADLYGLPAGDYPEIKGTPAPLSETEVKGGLLQDLVAGDPSGTIALQSLLGTDVVPSIDENGNVVYTSRFAAPGTTPVLSESEQKGQIVAGLTPEQQISAALGTDVVQTIDDNGNIIYTPRYEAGGKTPVPGTVQGLDTYVRSDGTTFVGYADAMGKIHDQSGAPVPDAVKKGVSDSNQNLQGLDTYVTSAGKTFVGYADPKGQIHDSTTGAVVPDVVGKGKPDSSNLQGLDSYVRADGTTFVGYADNTGKIHNQNGQLEPDAIRKGELPASTQGAVGKTTDAMLRSGFAAKMSEPSTKRLLAAYDDPAQMPTAADMNIWPTLNQMARSESISTATIGRFLNDQAMSPAGREFFLNLTNILPYELMQKSGAATTQTDWATSLASAVPQPNDTPTMRQVRKERLETFIKATYGMAAGTPVVDPAATSPQATGTPETPPPAAAAPAAAAPDPNDTVDEYVRDPVTKKLVKAK